MCNPSSRPIEPVPKLNERSQFRLFMVAVRKRLTELDFNRFSETRMALDSVARNAERLPGGGTCFGGLGHPVMD